VGFKTQQLRFLVIIFNGPETRQTTLKRDAVNGR
jgi:hypothetical protein